MKNFSQCFAVFKTQCRAVFTRQHTAKHRANTAKHCGNFFMNRIQEAFQKKGKDLLNIYFTAGYPTLDATVPLIQTLAAAGADLISAELR